MALQFLSLFYCIKFFPLDPILLFISLILVVTWNIFVHKQQELDKQFLGFLEVWLCLVIETLEFLRLFQNKRGDGM